MTEMVTSGSMSGDARRSDGLLGESGHERRRSQQAPPVLYATARVLDSTSDAANADATRAAYAAFERTWAKRCPGVVTSLREGGNELFTFFTFPKAQWKTLRSTNAIERLHGEFRRRVKTQGSLPSEDAALILLFSLVVSGQIKLRRIDSWRKIAAMLSQHTSV